MFSKILIANRGEIACRVMVTARRLGIATVAVYSDADAHSLFVKLADEAYRLGPPPAAESYLRGDAIIDIARQCGAQAIHPGYGFLSENADFCRRCEQAGIAFVGPRAEAIAEMGSKAAAKRIMGEASVPMVPGYHGESQDDDLLQEEAKTIGFPLLIKAVSGGGGKGMRVVENAADFMEQLQGARREAKKSFGDDSVLLERYLQQPRHVEVQIFFDEAGQGVYLGDRDCSLQRRHQKIIEEAPAPGLSDGLRKAMGEAAVRAGAAIHYRGAGTVEFLLDVDEHFYFMEMNTRLQVEHPVSECVSGVDLVEWQLRVAAGEPLPLTQDDIQISGHAIEARLYAEDVDNNFLPATGTLQRLQFPAPTSQLRIDTGVQEGDVVSVHYDPMLAKVIVSGDCRRDCAQRLALSLSQIQLSGVTTNRAMLYNTLLAAPFLDAELNTRFIEQHLPSLLAPITGKTAITIAASLYVLPMAENKHLSSWHSGDDWRMNLKDERFLSLVVEAKACSLRTRRSGSTVEIQMGSEHCTSNLLEPMNEHGQLCIEVEGQHFRGHYQRCGREHFFYTSQGLVHFSEPQFDAGASHDSGSLAAPMSGTVVAVLVSAGQVVNKGQALMVMEAMKMEHTLRAPADGCVDALNFAVGDRVNGGDELLHFSASEEVGKKSEATS